MAFGRSISLISVLTLFFSNASGVENSFNGVTCKTDIPSALIGRHMPNEPIVATEARHKNIGLKNLGAYGMESEGYPWTLISWQICGREYLLLQRRGIVRDVLASPLLKGSPQSQLASCTADGSSLNGTAVVFASGNEKQWPKPVEYAWLINNKNISFSRIEGKKLFAT